MVALLGRLLLWLLVWYGAQTFAPDSSRFALYGVIAVLPPALAWAGEELGSRGVGNTGPARSQLIVLASLESIFAVIVATIGVWIAPLLAIAGLLLVACGLASVSMSISGSLEVMTLDDGLHIRQRRLSKVYPWPSLRVRRRGRTLWFQSNGKQVMGRFSLARGEELRLAMQARGVPVVEEEATDDSLLPAFLIGVACALLPILIMGS